MRGLFLIVIFVASVYFFISHQKHKQQEQKKVEEVKKVIRKEEFKNIDPSLPDYITNEYMLQFSKTTIETLRKLVYDTNENVRFAAIELLWQLKDRDIQKIIKKALDTETEAEIKIKIIDMLSKEKSRLSLHLIAHALNNYEKNVRARACEVMGDFIDRQTIDLLT
ncbi:MAG: HEAT repeat domain-containing protein, partial [Elusimicrobiales bacterium]